MKMLEIVVTQLCRKFAVHNQLVDSDVPIADQEWLQDRVHLLAELVGYPLDHLKMSPRRAAAIDDLVDENKDAIWDALENKHEGWPPNLLENKLKKCDMRVKADTNPNVARNM